MDQRLIAAARAAGDALYDADAQLLRMPAHGNKAHTRIQTGLVHPFNHSAAYALALLESDGEGRRGRAAEILRRLTAAQDADPESPTFGVWSYVAEEPLAQMARPDPNWADFIGHELLLIALRHGQALPNAVLDEVRGAIHRAATAIRRRDVSMAYTNIAAKGTFVTLAAGELLDDGELLTYGRDRMDRFAAEVGRFDSFAEYNSPTYWLVTCTAVTSIAQFVVDEKARELAGAIRDQLWTHLVRRWHPPTGQLAGPMSRAYDTDLADNVHLLAFLAKAAGFRAPFDALPDVERSDPRQRLGLTSTALLDPAAPTAAVEALTSDPVAHRPDERRETFSAGPPARAGTTWLGRTAAVGSISHADSWAQRRNLLCVWRDDGPSWHRPASYAWLRVTKDDLDFVSGTFSAVQAGPHVLWHVGIASPGGDWHVYRNEISGPVPMRSVRVRLEIGHVDGVRVEVDGASAEPGATFGLGAEIAVHDTAATLLLRFVGGEFGDSTPVGRLRAEGGRIFVDLDLLDLPEASLVDLARLGRAWAAGTLTVVDHPATSGDLSGSKALSKARKVSTGEDEVALTWVPERGGAALELRARAAVGTVERHAATYRAFVDGVPREGALDVRSR